MSKITNRASTPAGKRSAKASSEKETVTLHCTFTRDVFNKLTAIKKNKGLFTEQEVIRIFVSNGINAS